MVINHPLPVGILRCELALSTHARERPQPQTTVSSRIETFVGEREKILRLIEVAAVPSGSVLTRIACLHVERGYESVGVLAPGECGLGCVIFCSRGCLMTMGDQHQGASLNFAAAR